MLIGELSERTGASTRSLRYYELKGIISGERLENGYRDFDGAQAGRVRSAQFYLGLGISTDTIATILDCRGDDSLPEAGGRCEGALLTLYLEKREEIEGQIEALTQARARIGERISLFEKQGKNARSSSPPTFPESRRYQRR